MDDLSQHKLEFRALMNVVYHERAERFHQVLLNVTGFLSIILSSAAFATLIPQTFYVSQRVIIGLATFLVAGLNAAVLAFGVTQKLMDHRQFKQKWMALLGDVRKAGDADLDALSARFYAINAEEPPPNTKRLDRAYRDACQRMGLEPEA